MSHPSIQGGLVIQRATEQHALLRDLLSAGASSIDLAEVSECDTAGAQLLVAAHRAVHAQGGKLNLINVTTPVRDVLCRYGLDALLGV